MAEDEADKSANAQSAPVTGDADSGEPGSGSVKLDTWADQQPDSGSQPLRQDQVQNAVAFLSHPKVRGSSKEAKRSFLERKGLTPAEIDEGMRQVPDTAAAATAGGAEASTSGAGGQHAAANPRLAGSAGQAPHPAQQGQQQLAAAPLQPRPEGIRWSQAVLGAGVVAAAVYGVRHLAAPTVGDWWDRWHGRPTREERAAAEKAKEAANALALAEAIKAQSQQICTSVDGLKDSLRGLEERVSRAEAGGRPQGSVSLSLAELRQELRSFATTLNEFGSPAQAQAGTSGELQQELDSIKQLLAAVAAQQHGSPDTAGSARGPARNGLADAGPAPVSKQLPFSPASHHTPAGASTLLQSSSASAPDGAIPHGRAAENGGSALPALSVRTSEPASPEEDEAEPSHPASYKAVLEMLEKGETPPGIRTDIRDVPTDPSQPITGPRLKPRAKPWERAQQGSNGLQAGSSGSLQHATAGMSQPAGQSYEAVVKQGGSNDVGGKENQGGTSPGSAKGAVWRAPPAPQPSLNLNKKA